jgi:phage/plasmid-like protein (TIGR03299 family)
MIRLSTQRKTLQMQIATQASLDWNVLACPMSVQLPDGTSREVTTRKVLVRDDNFDQVGVVGNRYEIVQNSVITGLVQPLVSEGLLEIVNQGYLGTGSKVFIQAELNQEYEIAGETHKAMLTLMNSHDGTSPLAAGITDTRVICQNTFAMAMEDMSTRLQHKLGINEQALKITETLDFVNDRMRKFAEAATVLKSTKATVGQVDQIILSAYGKKENETVRNRDEIVNRFFAGAGNDGATLWDAFNALTDFNTHASGKTAEARFGYANFGTGARVARRAIDMALTLA